MNMSWFGPKPFVQICTDLRHVSTPVDVPCAWCNETIAEGDSGFTQPFEFVVFHDECMIRQVMGGYNHLTGVCTCCGGTSPPDPEILTRRQAAKLAAEFVRGFLYNTK